MNVRNKLACSSLAGFFVPSSTFEGKVRSLPLSGCLEERGFIRYMNTRNKLECSSLVPSLMFVGKARSLP